MKVKNMKKIVFSDFGAKLTGNSGILQLMDDLGQPLPENMPSYQLGGGNPARIAQLDSMYRAEMEKIMADGDSFGDLIGRYDAPAGRVSFCHDVAEYLSNKYGWDIDAENIAVTNGSQTAMFYLFNLFAGTSTVNGKKVKRTVVFPLVPEYIGYADQGIEPDMFVGIPAGFQRYEDNTFKYQVNFPLLEKYLAEHDNVGALCVTRPTNPTGNVLTDDEIRRLSNLALKYDIPLIVDNAYGLPWPDIIFTDNAEPFFGPNVILSMSLSKIGLPSMRTGIIIAPKEIAKAVGNINAIAALTTASAGQRLASNLIKSGTLVEYARKFVRPFYEKKSIQTQAFIHKYLSGTDYAVHKSERAIFLWLLLPQLSITTRQMYHELKKRGVIVVPGEYFFFGNATDGSLPKVEDHPHYTKCLRINYSRPENEVEEGIKIIAEVYSQFRTE